MILTKTFDNTLAAFVDPKVKIICNVGGSSSSKTFSTLQLLYLFCLKNKSQDLISVVSENLPHLKRGCIRDMQNILAAENQWNQRNYNKSEQVLSINNKKIEFFGADSPSKLHGGRRDYLFINEANHIGWEQYTQLIIRTKKKAIIDWNPSVEFWADTELKGRDDVAWLVSTYRDCINGGKYCIPQTVIDEIESRKFDKHGNISDWYKVYGLGQQGSLEGAVYTDWSQCDKFPWEANKISGFIDFGFTNDPCAGGVAGIYNGKLYAKQLWYRSGMRNIHIAQEIKKQKLQHLTFICDSAEPKSISDLRAEGINVRPAKKPPGSINQGIELLQNQELIVTKDSLNAVKELRNYSWLKDKYTGKYINSPVDDWNHWLDGLRYYAIIHLDKGNKITTGRL